MRLTTGVADAVVLMLVSSLALIVAGCGATHAPTARSDARVAEGTQPRADGVYGRLPRLFEVNQGQADTEVKFLSRGGGYTLLLTGTEAVLSKTGATADLSMLRIGLAGASPGPRVVGLEQLDSRVNYFIGGDPTRWRTNVPTYARVQYTSVYPGIDLVYHADNGQLEFDFVVAPGADPDIITIDLRGAAGIDVEANGHLLVQTAGGPVELRRPFVYQELDGRKRDVAGTYVLKGGNRVGFQLGAYDAGRRLVIDPVLSYATTVAGGSGEQILGVAVDASANAYVTGWTFPFSGPSTSDAFVAKLNASGSALVYVTYFGGDGVDRGLGIAVDSSGTAYVTGGTTSDSFPLAGGPLSGGSDAFVARFSSLGVLFNAVRLGGSGEEEGMAIAVGPVVAGLVRAYVTGYTTSTDLPVTSDAVQRTNAGDRDAFVGVVDFQDQNIRSTSYLTYLGGSGFDQGSAIAVDASGVAYVTGFTLSSDFPTSSAAYQRFFGGDADAFVVKLIPGGPSLLSSTFLGGQGGEGGRGIAVHRGEVYVTGTTGRFANCGQPPPAPYCRTDLNDFPTTGGAFQTTSPEAPDNTISSVGDAFVTKLNPTLSALVYSTYLGGRLGDGAVAIAVDHLGNAYVTGFTSSINFPTLNPIQPPTGNDFGDAFVAKLNPSGSALSYSTYLGGTEFDRGRWIAVDGTGNAYVVGDTFSNDFPTVNPLQPNGPQGMPRSFVMKINAADSATLPPVTFITATVSTAPGVAGEAGVSATLTHSSLLRTATVTVENLAGNPARAGVIDVGGRFVDLKVVGADLSDTMTAYFYYPTTVPDGIATLLYFNGLSWAPVLSRGGTPPEKDPADDQDGTVSGGRFTVVFDDSSTPRITELTGTPFTMAVLSASDGLALLASRVGELHLSRGQKKELLHTLQAAQRALAHGHRRKAVHELREFIDDVRALGRRRLLDSTSAGPLIFLARAIAHHLVDALKHGGPFTARD